MFAKSVHDPASDRTPESEGGASSGRLSFRAVVCAAAVTLPLLLLLAGCNSAGTGIFYSVENEKKVSNASNNLPNDIVAVSLTQYNNGSGVNALYEASGTVYGIDYSAATTTTTGTWNTLAAPPGLSNPWCTQVAVAGATPTLYAIYGDSLDGSQGSVYQAQPSAPSGSNGQNVNWSPVNSSFTFASGSATVAESLFVANNTLFVGEMTDTGSGFSYSLYSWNLAGGSTGFATVITGLNGPVVGVSYDSVDNGGEYWFATGADIYFATNSGGVGGTWTVTQDPNEPKLPSGNVYGGIYWTAGPGSSGNNLLLSTRSLTATTGAGYVYVRSGAQSYAGTPSSASWISNSSAIAYNLTSFGEITLGGTDVIVVGADQGYYELDLGTSGWDGSIYTPTQGGSLTTDLNYVNVALKTSAVNGFFAVPQPNPTILFAMSTQGLWVNNEPSSGNGTWEPE